MQKRGNPVPVGEAMKELGLFLPEMDTQQERQAARILRILPGVVEVRLVSQGLRLSFRPETITDRQICEALRREGFRPFVFRIPGSREKRPVFARQA